MPRRRRAPRLHRYRTALTDDAVEGGALDPESGSAAVDIRLEGDRKPMMSRRARGERLMVRRVGLVLTLAVLWAGAGSALLASPALAGDVDSNGVLSAAVYNGTP